MFTGIIEELGEIAAIRALTAGARLSVRCRLVLEDISAGASIAVNGVCLTAAAFDSSAFSADVSPETLGRSNLGDLRAGAVVNLERPLSPSGRLGGHLVQGHVDTTGEFLGFEAVGGGNWLLSVRISEEADRYVVEKGSIAIDGVSLTVASIEDGVLGAAIIAHTYEHTALKARRRGDRVNLEYDVLAKYVEKLLAPRREKLSLEKLRDLGF